MPSKWHQQGFTLIELLVVVAILAILSGVAVPRAMDALSDARKNADDVNTALLQSAVERYYLATSKYPTADGSLDKAIDSDAKFLIGTKEHRFVPDYISKIPTPKGQAGVYYINANGVVVIK